MSIKAILVCNYQHVDSVCVHACVRACVLNQQYDTLTLQNIFATEIRGWWELSTRDFKKLTQGILKVVVQTVAEIARDTRTWTKTSLDAVFICSRFVLFWVKHRCPHSHSYDHRGWQVLEYQVSHRCLLSISPLQCYCLLAYQGRRQCLVSSQPWATPPSSFPSTRFVFFLRETKYCQSSAGTPLYTEEGRKGTVGNGHDVSVNSWLSERTRRGIICLSSRNNSLPGGMSCESICSACTICQPGTIFCLVTYRAKCLCFLVMRQTNCSACTICQPGTVFCLVTCAKNTCSVCTICHSGTVCCLATCAKSPALPAWYVTPA